MGKRSTKENKNIYQQSREALGLTREQAAEQMVFVSADRIEKIENERSSAHPDEVLAMAACYKRPELCNQFCSRECPIGRQYVPEIKSKELAQIVLELLASLNTMQQKKDRLVEIVADGEISDDEYRDFAAIRDQLAKMALTVNGLQLWLDKTIADGKIDREKLNG